MGITMNQNVQSINTSNYSFGDPEAVLSDTICDYLDVFSNGDYHVPPVSLKGLAKLIKANPHHSTILYFKRNMLMKYFKPTKYLSHRDMERAVFEFEVFGNCYFQKVRNQLGGFLRLRHLPALRQRRLLKKGQYGWINNKHEVKKYRTGDVVHLLNYDVNQGIYGIPEYLGALHAILLNEDATLFRRKYFKNGAHMGYIFYTNDPNIDDETEKALKDKIANSRGVGNFRSMYINIPNGSEKAVQLIPVGDIATKDEFERIKNISRNDIISAGRVPPALAGVMPENTGGFGDVEKISRVYFENEILPKQTFFESINEQLGVEAVVFNNPSSECDD